MRVAGHEGVNLREVQVCTGRSWVEFNCSEECAPRLLQLPELFQDIRQRIVSVGEVGPERDSLPAKGKRLLRLPTH
jgi:hypothetical protein